MTNKAKRSPPNRPLKGLLSAALGAASCAASLSPPTASFTPCTASEAPAGVVCSALSFAPATHAQAQTCASNARGDAA